MALKGKHLALRAVLLVINQGHHSFFYPEMCLPFDLKRISKNLGQEQQLPGHIFLEVFASLFPKI